MADNNRLAVLNSVRLSGTTQELMERLNDNFTELDERNTDTQAALDDKVDKETGKGLSSNDYTTAEKNKLAGVNAGAQVNVLEGVQVNGSDLPISGKKVNIPYDLSSFITNTVDTLVNYYKKSETYTKTEVNTLIGNIKTIQIQVVQTLPATGQSNIIYLVPKTGSTTGSYTEYIWVADISSFEEIGDTDVDLSNYPTIAEMNAAIATALTSYYTSAQIDTLLSGKADKTQLNDYLPKTTKYGASLSVSGRSVQLKDQDGNNLGSPIQTQDTTYSPATTSADGLMSSTDKSKLNGISAGANKVEASNTNGYIKIDGVEVKVYELPAIDQITEYSFTAASWGSAVGGIYTLTLPATGAKRPLVCYNNNNEQVMVTLAYNGTNITAKSDEQFAGKILAI